MPAQKARSCAPHGKTKSRKNIKKTTILLDDRFGCWHQPIVPGRRQPSIVGTNELNFCVRNGNRWTLVVINTNYLVAVLSGGLVIIPHRFENCKPFLKKFLKKILFSSFYRFPGGNTQKQVKFGKEACAKPENRFARTELYARRGMPPKRTQTVPADGITNRRSGSV